MAPSGTSQWCTVDGTAGVESRTWRGSAPQKHQVDARVAAPCLRPRQSSCLDGGQRDQTGSHQAATGGCRQSGHDATFAVDSCQAVWRCSCTPRGRGDLKRFIALTRESTAGVVCVARLLYIRVMRSATFPPIRVEPEVRAEVEAVLREGETLTQFIEEAVVAAAAWRRVQSEFITRGEAAIERWKHEGGGQGVDEVMSDLQARLDDAKRRAAQRAGR